MSGAVRKRRFYRRHAEELRQKRRDRYWKTERERAGTADRALLKGRMETDVKPRTWKLPGPDGQIYEVKCYTVGQLAKLLNRDAQTIRKWEKQGVIPIPTLRDDVGPSGRRLYTDDQVRAVVSARDAIRTEKFRSWKESRFPKLVSDAWGALGEYGFNPDNYTPIPDPSEDDRAATVQRNEA